MTTAERLIKYGAEFSKTNIIKRGCLHVDAPTLAFIVEMRLEQVEEVIDLIKLGLI
jgi:hypothetical protein